MITPTYPKPINNSLSNPTASEDAEAATAAPETEEAAVTAVADEALAATVGFVNNFIDSGMSYIFIIYIFKTHNCIATI